MFRVEIEFKPELKDVTKYCSAVDDIFAERNMPCIHRSDTVRVYGDSGNPKDIGVLYAAVGAIRRTPWIVDGIRDAHFDNGSHKDNSCLHLSRGAN